MIHRNEKAKSRKSKKKYRKILPVAMISIFAIMLLSIIFQFSATIQKIHEQYDSQIKDITTQCKDMEEYYNRFSQDYLSCTASSLEGIRYFLSHSSPKHLKEEFDTYISTLSFIHSGYYVNEQKEIILEYHDDIFNEKVTVDFTDEKFQTLFEKTEEEFHSLSVGDYFYSCLPYNNGYLILMDFDRSMEKTFDDQNFWKFLLENVWIGDHGYLAVFDTQKNQIIYSKDDSLIGKNNEFQHDQKHFHDYTLYIIGDKLFLGKAYPYKDKKIELFALTPISDIILSCIHSTKILGILSSSIILLMLLYTLCLRNYNIQNINEKRFLGRFFVIEHKKKFLVLVLISELVLFVSSFLLLNIASITEQARNLQDNSNLSLEIVEEYDDLADVQIYQPKYINFVKAHIIEKYLRLHPEESNKNSLKKLSQIFVVDYISVFDAEGHTIATSSPFDHLYLLEDKKNPFYDFRKVLMGRDELDVDADKDYLGEPLTYYGVARRDKNDIANGIVAITLYTNEWYSANVFNQSLKNLCAGEGAFLFMVDQDKTISYYPDEKYIGESISDLGLSEKSLKTNEMHFITLEGEKYYSAVAKNNHGYVFSVIPFHWYDQSAFIRSLITVLLLIPASLWTYYFGLGNRYSYLTGKDKKGNDYIPPKKQRYQKVQKFMDWVYQKQLASRHSDDDLLLSNRAEMHFFWILKILIHIASFYLIFNYMFYHNKDMTQSILRYITSGRWGKSINIFSLVANGCLLLVTYTLISLANLFLQTIAHLLNAKGKTICRLLSSVVKYVGACACFYQITTNIGIDAKTTLASLGIAAMALGLGAQELIRDMIAGIFILFEGNYKVGDMLLIGTDRYWVKAIGIRTTKLESYGQIKIINNSQMTSVVNIQSSSTEVSLELKISNSHSVSEIEDIMKKELALLNDKFSGDVTPPEYKGVVNLDKNGMTILIKAYCPISKQGKVRRKMNRYIIMICEKYNIQLI